MAKIIRKKKDNRNFKFMTEAESTKLKKMFKEFGGYESFCDLYLEMYPNTSKVPGYQVVNGILNGRQQKTSVLEVLNAMVKKVIDSKSELKSTLENGD